MKTCNDIKGKVLFLSGASTKIPFLGGVALELIKHKNLQFNTFVGISSGAILSLPLAMGMYDDLEYYLLKFRTSDIFKHNPKSIKGKMKSISYILNGKFHLYDQSKLEVTLRNFIDKDQFYKWADSLSTPDAIVGSVCVETGEKRYVNLKNVSYSEAIKWVMASSSLPFFTEHIEIDGKHWHDGGTRDHIGSAWYISTGRAKNVKEIHNVFSRPKNLTGNEWFYPKHKNNGVSYFIAFIVLYFTDHLKPFGSIYVSKLLSLIMLAGSFMSVRIQKIIFRVVEIMSFEISKSDDREANYLCQINNIKSYNYYTPYKLTKLNDNYKVSEKTNLDWYNLGKKEANTIYNGN